MLYAGYRKPGEPNQRVETFETPEDGLKHILTLASPEIWQDDVESLYVALTGFNLDEHGECVEMLHGTQYFVVSESTWEDLQR